MDQTTVIVQGHWAFGEECKSGSTMHEISQRKTDCSNDDVSAC